MSNVMEVRRQQRRVVSRNLCYGDTLMSGPVTLSVTVWFGH